VQVDLRKARVIAAVSTVSHLLFYAVSAATRGKVF
jgi:hypothetical protein